MIGPRGRYVVREDVTMSMAPSVLSQDGVPRSSEVVRLTPLRLRSGRKGLRRSPLPVESELGPSPLKI